MKITLINTNPVVTRILELCARQEGVILEEIASVSSTEKTKCDILFVDRDAYDIEVAHLLANAEIGKKVLLSPEGEKIEGFDETIEKPFLPSQIIKILHSSKEEIRVPKILEVDEDETGIMALLNEHEEENERGETVLDNTEIEKIKALLDMDDNFFITNSPPELTLSAFSLL